MYESYWNLSSKPFQSRCPRNAMYQSQSLTSALLRLRYCFDNGGGLAALIGESGMGKTSLLSGFADETDRWTPFVHIRFCGLGAAELLRVAGSELCGFPLGEQTATLGQDHWLAMIQRAVLEGAHAGRTAVVAFDDAHQLTDQALQHTVAPLISIAESDPAIRLTIVLAGHPNLLPRLQRHAPLAERTEVMCVLQGWSLQETAEYIRQSLDSAGASQPIFTGDAIRSVFEWSAGNPRRINRLCDMALLVGFAEQRKQVTAAEIDAVSAELLENAA